jgi:hypothetical protein
MVAKSRRLERQAQYAIRRRKDPTLTSQTERDLASSASFALILALPLPLAPTAAVAVAMPGLIRRLHSTLTNTFSHSLPILLAQLLAFLVGGLRTHLFAMLLTFLGRHQTASTTLSLPLSLPPSLSLAGRGGPFATRTPAPRSAALAWDVGKLDPLLPRALPHFLLVSCSHRGALFFRFERSHRRAVLVPFLLGHQLRPHDRDLLFLYVLREGSGSHEPHQTGCGQ